MLWPTQAAKHAARVEEEYERLRLLYRRTGRVPPSLDVLLEEARRSFDDSLTVIQRARR